MAIIATALEYSAAGGQGIAAFWAHWASAVLYNGLARYEEAARAARQATSGNILPYLPLWALPELVEASARAGDTEAAHDALARLAEMAQACGTDAPLGVAARCRALLSDGDTAEDLYGESIARLTRTPLRPELARAHLLYGEWLRRAGRRLEARDQLRTAHDEFVAIGMEAFADRARRELLATGMTPRKRTVEARNDLTPTEVQIASLARDGLSNSEIASQLFLSPRTVEWHLRRVFTKLGISRRGQLVGVLRDEAR
jgi:DNA-binding CsgD family transcriptional regulator